MNVTVQCKIHTGKTEVEARVEANGEKGWVSLNVDVMSVNKSIFLRLNPILHGGDGFHHF